MPIRAGGSGSSTFVFVSVSKSRIDPPERLFAGQRGDHGPQLGAALTPGQRDAKRTQVTAHRFQLSNERAGVHASVRTLEQLAKAFQRLGRVGLDRRRAA